MTREYDKTISEHYKKVAEEYGLLSTSTMTDEMTRIKETESIMIFLEESLRLLQLSKSRKKITIMDVGCGNGYTLFKMAERFPDNNYIGIEKSKELRELASSRFDGVGNVKIFEGDIRESDFSNGIIADILICQRVLINLLTLADQKAALNNILSTVRSPKNSDLGGTLLFVECFNGPLKRLNEARNEFDLPSMLPAHHNRYLQDDFFKTNKLELLLVDGNYMVPSNFLSTHYYVTRVLHPIFTPKDKEFKRNSEFVKFFTEALKSNAGDYSPLKIYMFKKII